MSAEAFAVSDSQYRQNAERLMSALDDEAEQAYRAGSDEANANPAFALARGLGPGDVENLRGDTWEPVKLSGARLGDLADDLITGKPISVYMLEPEAWGQYPLLSRPNTACTDAAARLIGLFGRLGRLSGSSPLTVTPIPEKRMHLEGYKQYLAALPGIMSEHGLSGDDFSLKTAPEPVKLVDKLGRSPNGRVVTEQGSVAFQPYDIYSKVDRGPDPHKEVKLRHASGRYTPSATLAGCLDAIGGQSKSKIVIADGFNTMVRAKDTYENTNILLKAVESPTENLRHAPQAIHYNLRVPSGLASYVLARELQKEVGKNLDAMERYRDSGTDPGWVLPYVGRNYGEGVIGKSEWDILPEDIELIQFLMNAALAYIPPHSLHSYRNIGRGPYSYLDAMFEPLMKPDAVMHLDDPSQEARVFTTDWKNGTLPPEFACIGPKFEQLMIGIGGMEHGHVWRDSDARARRKAVIRPGSLATLQDTHQIEVESFTSCSTSFRLADFRHAIRRRAEASEEWVIGLHMLGSKGWGDYASVPLSEKEVIDTYKNHANLAVVAHMVTTSSIKARAGYQGMMGVVARKKR